MRKIFLPVVEFDMKITNRNTYERQNIKDTEEILEAEYYDEFIGHSDGMNFIWEVLRNERKRKEKFN